MTPEMREQIEVNQRLDNIDETLRRICYELDWIVNGIRHLLAANGHRALAESIGEEIEKLHQERREQLREQLERSRPMTPDARGADADTLPPEAS